ncbi:hypothetical protein GUJ93_ZPchr0002g23571 [Zizania palustris]|uniref:Uncharacterized protein n=1 Tax=Zizania palustris TaxID=103762 RepID=A0A8J5SA64_ZIZPA|nr:hypothetical protein GUJ93_ZPchr0002g23571 [Zizania palustris]
MAVARRDRGARARADTGVVVLAASARARDAPAGARLSSATYVRYGPVHEHVRPSQADRYRRSPVSGHARNGEPER